MSKCQVSGVVLDSRCQTISDTVWGSRGYVQVIRVYGRKVLWRLWCKVVRYLFIKEFDVICQVTCV